MPGAFHAFRYRTHGSSGGNRLPTKTDSCGSAGRPEAPHYSLGISSLQTV